MWHVHVYSDLRPVWIKQERSEDDRNWSLIQQFQFRQLHKQVNLKCRIGTD